MGFITNGLGDKPLIQNDEMEMVSGEFGIAKRHKDMEPESNMDVELARESAQRNRRKADRGALAAFGAGIEAEKDIVEQIKEGMGK